MKDSLYWEALYVVTQLIYDKKYDPKNSASQLERIISSYSNGLSSDEIKHLEELAQRRNCNVLRKSR